jgi:hypothetical protein
MLFPCFSPLIRNDHWEMSYKSRKLAIERQQFWHRHRYSPSSRLAPMIMAVKDCSFRDLNTPLCFRSLVRKRPSMLKGSKRANLLPKAAICMELINIIELPAQKSYGLAGTTMQKGRPLLKCGSCWNIPLLLSNLSSMSFA